MKHWAKLFALITVTLLLLSCEEEVPDYAADIINTYIVESATTEGVSYDLTTLGIEDALFIEITREEVITYMNEDDHCLDTYEIETDEIDGVTETSVLFTDNSDVDYSFENGRLKLDDQGDILILAEYNDTFPPPSWTDPSQLTNDTYEPDNDFAHATTIAAGGTTQNHYLAECGDLDYYMFNAVAGTSYILTTETPVASSLDLTITLYTGAADSISYDDDDGVGLNPWLAWTCPTSGDYYFVLKGFWDDEYGDYSVSVSVSNGLLRPTGEAMEKTRQSQYKRSWNTRFFK